MGRHYFSKGDGGEGEPHRFTIRWRGQILAWECFPGVFSCRSLDRGAALLAEIVSAEEEGPCRFLDLGCGSGPVGLLFARAHTGSTVLCTDINLRAVRSAQRNASNLTLQGVRFLVADGAAPILPGRFDVVALNPPIRAGSTVVHRLVHAGWDMLDRKGRFYLVVRRKQGGDRLLATLQREFDPEAAMLERHKGYMVLHAGKA